MLSVEVYKFASELIDRADYDPQAGQLSVTLHGSKKDPEKRTYGYAGVQYKTWYDFKHASSAGRFYNTVVRKNHLSLGEIPPLGDSIDETYITSDDFKGLIVSPFDDVIATIEAEFKKQDMSEWDVPEEGEVAPERPVVGVALAKAEPMPQTTSAMFIPAERIEQLCDLALSYINSADGLLILDSDTLVAAEEEFKKGKDLYSAIAGEIQPVTRSHYETWKAYKDDENRILNPIDEATARLGKAIYRFRAEAERLAAIERQQNLEAARFAAKAEQERQTEALRAQLASEDPERAAEIMADTGIVAMPVPVFADHVDILPPKTGGIGVKKKFVAVVDDIESLILDIAEGIQVKATTGYPTSACVAPVKSVLDAAAKAKGSEGDLYPGVRVEIEGSIVKTREKK